MKSVPIAAYIVVQRPLLDLWKRLKRRAVHALSRSIGHLVPCVLVVVKEKGDVVRCLIAELLSVVRLFVFYIFAFR